MLNIDNYRLKIGSQNYYFDCSENREPPPRVPLASFGFQKPLANSGGNSSRVALRRSEFWRKRWFYFLAVSPEQNPNFFPKQSERGLTCAPRPLPAVAGAKPKIFLTFLLFLGGGCGGSRQKMERKFLVLLRRFRLQNEHCYYSICGSLALFISPSSRRDEALPLGVLW